MIDLAVVIVTWNVREIVLDALRTLYADLEQSNLTAQVVVVDSASSDGTVEAIRENYPQTTVIASDENLGFAKGNNVGMQSLRFGDSTQDVTQLPRAVYLLNPDTLTTIGSTQTLYETLFSDERNGVVGARLTFGDGSFQHSSFMFPGLRQLWVEFFPTPGRLIEHPFNGRYSRDKYHSEQAFKVDFMLGATMMLRREVIQQTNMFDLQFFMYAEEVDWQWRIHNAGWRILCEPQAHVVHLGGQSTGQVQPRSIVDLWTSRLRLYGKHYSTWKLLLAKALLAIGMTRKIQQAKQDKLDKEIIDAYRQVRTLALS
ncbi:MAG: glycosyltransferase family 2 protein [Chloroflexota bacterium]